MTPGMEYPLRQDCFAVARGALLWIRLAAFFMGLVFGSFANVLIYRVPRHMGGLWGRSRCPSCTNTIAWYDNIPVLSFLLLLGRCRHCGASISLRYPLVELMSAVLSLACLDLGMLRLWPSECMYSLLTFWAFAYAFCFILVTITFVDLDFFLVPPGLVLTGTGLGVLWNMVLGARTSVSLGQSLLGVLAGSLPLMAVAEVYAYLAKREGMGYGDVLVMGMVGANLGYQSVPFVLLAASLQGILVSVPVLFLHRQKSREKGDSAGKGASMRLAPVPFGPFLALGAIEWLFFRDAIIQVLAL